MTESPRPRRQRRNPRAERAAHQVANLPRPRFDLAAVPPDAGRPRPDPRAERRARLVPGTARPRYDMNRHDRGAAAVPPPAAVAAPAAPPVVVIDTPVHVILVVADCPAGRLSRHDRQCLGAARRLAGKAGDTAVVLAAPALGEPAGPAGADRVVLTGTAEANPAVTVAALAGLVADLAPRHVIFAESARGGDLARRLAVHLHEPLFAGAEQVSPAGVVRTFRGGRADQRGPAPRLITLAADMVPAHSGTVHEAREIEARGLEARGPESPVPPEPALQSPTARSGILAVEDIPADPATVALADAGFVVSAGNGVTDFAAFRRLAAALHGTPGASRVVCDAGLMPRAAQVGASGTVLTADCYFALGISGAPQHLQGIGACGAVIAVNTDLHAAMIERAGLAIVADAQQVMPALLKLLEEDPS